MKTRLRRRVLSVTLLAALAASSAGCTVDPDTISSLVDLASTTSAGAVQIAVKAAINGLLTLLQPPAVDATAAISTQKH
jgi:hypothetical protein